MLYMFKEGGKPKIKQLDKLWSEAVKLRAKQTCEYSGRTRDNGINLHAHHIGGKSNYALRWDLNNGVCIAGGVHKFVAHHSGRAKKFRDWALKLRGIDEDYLLLRGKVLCKSDLWGTMAYLKLQINVFSKADYVATR